MDGCWWMGFNRSTIVCKDGRNGNRRMSYVTRQLFCGHVFPYFASNKTTEIKKYQVAKNLVTVTVFFLLRAT